MEQHKQRKRNERNEKKIWKTILLFSSIMIIALFCTHPAMAATAPDTGSFVEVSHNFSHFFQNTQEVMKLILNDPNLSNFAITLWKFFSVISIVWFIALFTLNGASLSKLFIVIFMILLTRVLMTQYDMITTAMWGWSEGFAGGIQNAATGHTDLLWLVQYIWKTCTAMSFTSPALFFHPIAFIASLLMMLLTGLLVCLSAFVSIWALWGYALMKMIGFMFIPCLLFENVSWLFDGWFRCFIGFLLYNVIARANLVLIVVIFKNYFQTTMTIPHEGVLFIFHSITEGIGLCCFLTIGIIALCSTGGLVRSVISGSHVDISDGLRKVAMTVGAVGGM